MSTTAAPVARSPIAPAPPVAVVAGWEVSTRTSTAPLRMADLTPMAKVVIRGPEGWSGRVPFGRAERRGDMLEVGSGPGEWTLLGAPGSAADLLAAIDPGTTFVNGVDITHGRALLRLSGSDAVAMLAKVCAIDLADTVTPNGTALRTSVAKLVTDVIRDDHPDGTRSYLLHCERASGQHLWDCLLDAGAEFGIDIHGWPG